MRAIAIEQPGAPEVLVDVTEPVPGISEHEVLIKVSTAGVNRPDVLQRQGLYPVPKDASHLPGLEVAGEVVATGPAVDRWSVGDMVMALTHGGGPFRNRLYCLTCGRGLRLKVANAGYPNLPPRE